MLFSYVYLFYYLGSKSLALISLLTSIGHITLPVLNKKGFIHLSRILLFVQANVNIIFISIYFGKIHIKNHTCVILFVTIGGNNEMV